MISFEAAGRWIDRRPPFRALLIGMVYLGAAAALYRAGTSFGTLLAYVT